MLYNILVKRKKEITMTISERLDMAIKLDEAKTEEGAYKLTYNGEIREKSTYMTKPEWEAFLSAMPEKQKAFFEKGDGDEITEKNGLPPKMACYGSSSRLLYKLSRDIEGFVFEKKLPTTVGGKANLDGYLEAEDRLIFVEAKCHEPYSSKRCRVSVKYKELYEYITANSKGNLEIKAEPSACGRYLDVTFYTAGEKIEHLDIKQMICHLLGIATGILGGTLKRKKLGFIYLLYDPTRLPIKGNAKETVDGIYRQTVLECKGIDWCGLFSIILEFLFKIKKKSAVISEEIAEIASTLELKLTSQDSYRELFK